MGPAAGNMQNARRSGNFSNHPEASTSYQPDYHEPAQDYNRAPGSPMFRNGNGNSNWYHNNNQRSDRRRSGGHFAYNANANANSNASATFAPQGNLPESKHLTGTDNYAHWAFLMKALLKAEGIWNCVTGEESNTGLCSRAFSKICMNISSNVSSLVYDLTSAKDLWEKLASMYSESGLTRRCSILKAMFRCSLEDFNGSIVEYLDFLTASQQRLNAMKYGLSDQFLAVVMLSGLTSDYEPIIMGLENCEPLTAEKVRTRLLQHSSHKDTNDVNSCAFASSKPRHQKYQQQRRPNQKPHGQQEESAKEVICYRCGEPGHKSPGCIVVKKGRGKKKTPSNRAHMAETEDSEEQPEQASLCVSLTSSAMDSESLI